MVEEDLLGGLWVWCLRSPSVFCRTSKCKKNIFFSWLPVRYLLLQTHCLFYHALAHSLQQQIAKLESRQSRHSPPTPKKCLIKIFNLTEILVDSFSFLFFARLWKLFGITTWPRWSNTPELIGTQTFRLWTVCLKLNEESCSTEEKGQPLPTLLSSSLLKLSSPL